MRAVRKRLADGTVKTYWYPRRRGADETKSRFEAETVGALIAAYERGPEWALKKPRTRVYYQMYARFLDPILHVRVAEIERKHILLLRDAVMAKRGPGAANAFARTASMLLSWAVERGWLKASPLYRMKLIPGGRLPAWTAVQADYAQARLPEHLRRVVILARYTGQRRGDLVALRWSDYDGTTLRLRQQKTGAELKVPAHSVLRAELDAWRQNAQSVFILANSEGRPWLAESLTEVLKRWIVRIGLPRELSLHGIRKLSAVELAEAGCSAHEIAAITGHRTLAMVQLYAASADQERLATAAVIKLERKK